MSRYKREAMPRGMPVERPWRVPLAQSSVPASGLHLDLIADEQVRSRLARVVGLEGLPLEAGVVVESVELARRARPGLAY